MKKFLLLCSLLLVATSYAADPGYKVVKKIPLGGEGFWDYLIVDNAARRLYISHSSQVLVVDLNTYKLVGEIPA